MSARPSETTACLQTPPGRGGIAVVRLAGPETTKILRKVFRPRAAKEKHAPAAGQLQLGNLVDGSEVVDEAVVAATPDGAEINIHGGPVVLRRAMRLLAGAGATVKSAAGADTAFDPSHPKYRNPAIGREMLAALADATSSLAVAALSQQWSAGLSKLACAIRDDLNNPAAAKALRSAAAAFAKFRKLLSPAEVVLAGPPNAGKSTLANVLVGRAVSIVHHHPGTTRDWVRERATLAGVPIWLTDTAGLWNTDHAIDAEAVRRARQRIESADLVLLLSAADETNTVNLPEDVHAHAVMHVATKCDMAPSIARQHARMGSSQAAVVSAHTGEGMDELKQAILHALDMHDFDAAAPAAFTARQENLLIAAAEALENHNHPTAQLALTNLLEGESV